MRFLDTGRAMGDQRSQKSGEEKLQKGALKFTYTQGITGSSSTPSFDCTLSKEKSLALFLEAIY